jgi:hypothetical protein
MKKTAARTHITLESFIQIPPWPDWCAAAGTLIFTHAIELPEGQFCM